MSPRRTPAGAGNQIPRPSRLVAVDDVAGFRIVVEHHPPRSQWELEVRGATAIIIVVAGAVREDAPAGAILLPRTTIAIRPPKFPKVAFEASPAGAHTVTIELTEQILKAHPPSLSLLTKDRTFRGRSSVELAWRIAGELSGPDEMTPNALHILVRGIIVGTSRYFLHQREASATPPMAAAAQRILDRQLAKPPSLRALAKRVGCSPEHLARIFRASYGFSVRDWTTRRRVEAAKRLLTQGERQIGEIAQELGFCDTSHFARTFKRATTTTPARFRASHTGINPVLSSARPSNRNDSGGVRSLRD